ncbi:MAG TPA: SPOR domain-containing protein [Polyangiaceae bacterium]|jgi:cell division septation protein DedD
MDHGAVRNLEQIQEQDETTRTPRALSFVLVAIGGACIAFAVLAMGGRKTGTLEKRPDPLGELVANHGRAAGGAAPLPSSVTATQLSAKEVTFPSILSDDARPTTALAAVRPAPGVRGSSSPPPPTDRLPVVNFAGGTPPVPHDGMRAPAAAIPTDSGALTVAPARSTEIAVAAPQGGPSLPAQDVLEATPIVTRPRDALTKSASDSAQLGTAPAASAPSGREGGWQLQVSSFKTRSEADQFADQLRARGHKAYSVEAHVEGRGTWWRVRVGPFASRPAALAYRSQFEAKEHVVPFVVQPEKASEKP